MKRAKLRGLKRNAAVVRGNDGTAEDINALTRTLDDTELLVRDHTTWALAHIDNRQAPRPLSSVRTARAPRARAPAPGETR